MNIESIEIEKRNEEARVALVKIRERVRHLQDCDDMHEWIEKVDKGLEDMKEAKVWKGRLFVVLDAIQTDLGERAAVGYSNIAMEEKE